MLASEFQPMYSTICLATENQREEFVVRQQEDNMRCV